MPLRFWYFTADIRKQSYRQRQLYWHLLLVIISLTANSMLTPFNRMAPDDKQTIKSDVYSYGLVCMKLLTISVSCGQLLTPSFV